MSNRKQCVRINDTVSETTDVLYGVPQGSILGPLLYIIYVNDVFMQFNENDAKILLHADDTVLYSAHPQLKQLECIMMTGLSKLYDWCNLNKLTINITKTKYEIFRPKGLLNNPNNLDKLAI